MKTKRCDKSVKWQDEITIEDIDEQYRHIAEIIGVKNFIELTKKLGGTTWYIPKIDRVLNEARKKKIRKEFNRYNRKELALKYGVSERTISYLTEESKYNQLKLY